MKFEIEYIGYITVEAKDRNEANEIFVKNCNKIGYPTSFRELEPKKDHGISGTTHDVVGFCEVSGKSIFEDDEYYEDDDGVMVLKDQRNEPITNPKIKF